MSRKANLKKRIDALCQELGIADVPYSDTSSEAQLNTMIDELEDKLPGEDEPDDEVNQDNETGTEAEAAHSGDLASDKSQETQGADTGHTEVLVGIGELSDGESVDESSAPEVNTNDDGEMQVLVLKAFQSHTGQRSVLHNVGDKPYLDEETAMEAVEAGLANLIATL